MYRSIVIKHMKTNKVFAQGISGLNIDLNLMDMYSITHVVERWEDYIQIRDEYKAWSEKKDAACYWKMSEEDKKAWKAQNPEPRYCEPQFFEEIAPVLVFLKKLALPSTEQATVFEEETGAE